MTVRVFYFSQYSLVNFAGEFVKRGGKVLLIDQVFKLPHWSHDLRTCYDRYPNLKIVFTGSSVMRLKDENPELNGIVQSYNLRGFSFREFLNLQTGNHFSAYTLDEILTGHEHIAKTILPHINPLNYLQDYIHHGFYPFFLEKRNFSENLLKTMNMMIEVAQHQPACFRYTDVTCYGNELHQIPCRRTADKHGISEGRSLPEKTG